MAEENMAEDILKMLGEDEQESASEPEDEGAQESTKSEESENQATGEESEQSEQEAEGGEEQEGSSASEEGEVETEGGETQAGTEGESEEDDELTKERKRREKLEEQVNELSKKIPQEQSQVEGQEAGQEETSPIDALKEYSFDNIVESEETFWKFVNDLITQVQSKTEEQTMKKIPQVVQSTAQEQIELREKASQFYSENPELAQSKPFVANITNQVWSEHPDWGFDDILNETANRARDALGLEKQAKQNEKDSKSKEGRNPAFAKTGQKSSRRESSGKSELEKELEEMRNTQG